MIDLREFYNDYYDKTIERKNEINNSLSIPIGIITALIAALFYIVTNFGFHLNIYLSLAFVIIAILSVCLLGCSIYYLIKTFSNFHGGYSYAYIGGADLLDQYYNSLLQYYMLSPNAMIVNNTDQAKIEFNNYIIKLLIFCGNANHANNEKKDFQRHNCHQFMIYAIFSLTLLFVVFYVNFVFN